MNFLKKYSVLIAATALLFAMAIAPTASHASEVVWSVSDSGSAVLAVVRADALENGGIGNEGTGEQVFGGRPSEGTGVGCSGHVCDAAPGGPIANRVCYDAAPGSFASSEVTTEYDSVNASNQVIQWDGNASLFSTGNGSSNNNLWTSFNPSGTLNRFIESVACSVNTPPNPTLVANPTSITSGGSSTLTYNIGAQTSDETCTASNFTFPTQTITVDQSSCSGGFINICITLPVQETTTNFTSGSVVVSPGSTTTYGYTCSDANGSVTANATVTVGASLPPAPTASISSLPSTIAPGGGSTLTWGSTGASECVGSGFNTGNATSGTAKVSPGSTTTYSVTCSGPGGSSVTSTTVTVSSNPPNGTVTATLIADPTSIPSGSSSKLTWTSSNATACSINNGVGAVSPARGGSVQVSPNSTTKYTVTCTGAGGSGTGSATVTVTAVGGSLECSPSPSSVAPNQPVTWRVTSAPIGYTIFNWSSGFGVPRLGFGSTFTDSFSSVGNYAMNLQARSGFGGTLSATCAPVTVTRSGLPPGGGFGGSGGGGSCSGSPALSLSPSIDRVDQTNNRGVTLTYAASGIPFGETCTLSGPGISPTTSAGANSSCIVATSTVATAMLTTQSIYTLSCAGVATTTIVNVAPIYNEF